MKKGVFILFIFCSGSLLAQDIGSIDTDRPDQSDGVFTLPSGKFQVETGFIYGKAVDDYFMNNTMVRLGLTQSTEVRLAVDYGRQTGTTGLMPVGLSIKQNLWHEKGALPTTTLIGTINLPFLASTPFKTDKVSWGLTLAFENGLSDKFTLAYNFGTFTDGFTNELIWLWTTNLGYSVSDKVSIFAEYFGNYTEVAQPSHNADIGLLWLLQENLQLDLAMGTRIFDQAEKDQFVTVGFSYRFDG